MKCPICSRSQYKHCLFPRRGGEIYICSNCINAYTIPVPAVEYTHDSFFQAAEDQEKLFRSYAKPIIQFIKSVKPGGRLLDIGTGGGYLMEEAKGQGFDPYGIEPSSGAVLFCKKRKLKVKKGYFKDGMFPQRYFDVIVASHVLEHVPNPQKFLKSASKILKDDGVLCLSQTNYTGTIPKLYGRFWEGWVPDQHFVHFSPVGIEFLLKKTGYSLCKIKLIPLGYFFRLGFKNLPDIANTLYSNMSFIISKLKIGFPFVPDQLYVLAKKTSEIK